MGKIGKLLFPMIGKKSNSGLQNCQMGERDVFIPSELVGAGDNALSRVLPLM